MYTWPLRLTPMIMYSTVLCGLEYTNNIAIVSHPPQTLFECPPPPK